jgi:predicted transcriptional regulator
MTEVKKQDIVEVDSILDDEDEATLAAIDRGTKAADEGRVVSCEEARRRLRESYKELHTSWLVPSVAS